MIKEDARHVRCLYAHWNSHHQPQARHGLQRGAKFWVSNVDDYDYKIEYLKFEEGTPFPEEIHRNPHVAYLVDDLEKYIADADSVICGPMAANDKGDRLAFVWKDGAILELYQEA